VAADLGTWPAEQASVLLEVLQANGLHPEARRTRGEVHVSVPEDEGDKAHATLVAHMDAIARAARPSKPSGPGRGKGRLRAVDPQTPKGRGKRSSKPAGSGGARRASPARPTSSAGGGRAASPIVIGVLGFGAAVLAAGNGLSPGFPLAVATGALVWVLGKQAERT
jgi:hypothetical protein